MRREQVALRVLVEIDHDVPAEDRVERSLHRKVRHEVELLERDEIAQLGRRGVAPAGR